MPLGRHNATPKAISRSLGLPRYSADVLMEYTPN